MSPPQGRRRTDRAGWPIRDRLSYRWARVRGCMRARTNELLLVLVVCSFALSGLSQLSARTANRDAARAADDAAAAARQATEALRAQRAANERSTALDAARLYQRCEQTTAVVRSVNQLIRRGNDQLGLLPLVDEPDCAAIYPRGARESARYPDAAPTRPPRRHP